MLNLNQENFFTFSISENSPTSPMSLTAQNFRNILFASGGGDDEISGLKQAVSLARNNAARLSVVEIRPELPPKLEPYRSDFEKSALREAAARLDTVCGELGVNRDTLAIEVEVMTHRRPAIALVQRVLGQEHDLLVKNAEVGEGGKRLRAIDMALLRKCPCPVWLWRPITRHRNEIRVAVAIDPENNEDEARSLSHHLLTLARSIADDCDGNLSIVSCWDGGMENYLRNSFLAGMPDEEAIHEAVTEARDTHRAGLESLVEESGISGNHEIHQLKGRPDEAIPAFVEEAGIDIMVMGTVARVGIAGLVIGNTAENILQQLTCTLVAVKPPGFETPIKPTDS